MMSLEFAAIEIPFMTGGGEVLFELPSLRIYQVVEVLCTQVLGAEVHRHEHGFSADIHGRRAGKLL